MTHQEIADRFREVLAHATDGKMVTLAHTTEDMCREIDARVSRIAKQASAEDNEDLTAEIKAVKEARDKAWADLEQLRRKSREQISELTDERDVLRREHERTKAITKQLAPVMVECACGARFYTDEDAKAHECELRR